MSGQHPHIVTACSVVGDCDCEEDVFGDARDFLLSPQFILLDPKHKHVFLGTVRSGMGLSSLDGVSSWPFYTEVEQWALDPVVMEKYDAKCYERLKG